MKNNLIGQQILSCRIGIFQGGFTMKCMKCHNTLHSETGEFSMAINGKSIKVINAPVLHTLDYAECEAGTIMSVMNLLL